MSLFSPESPLVSPDFSPPIWPEVDLVLSCIFASIHRNQLCPTLANRVNQTVGIEGRIGVEHYALTV